MTKTPTKTEAKPPKFLSYTALQTLTWDGQVYQPGDRIDTRFYKPGKVLIQLQADCKIREIKRGRPPKLQPDDAKPDAAAGASSSDAPNPGNASGWVGMFAGKPKPAPEAVAAPAKTPQQVVCVACGWVGDSPVKRTLRVSGRDYPIECRECMAITLEPLSDAKALQRSAAEAASAESVFELLDPATIAPSPVNPRRHFVQDAMDELVEGVREHGVRTPIQVRRIPEGAWHVKKTIVGFAEEWLIECAAFPLLAAKLPTDILRSRFPSQAEAVAALPRYEIIAGERRWRAARLAGSKTIRAMVEAADDIEAAELQAIENLQRVELSDIEEATGYQYMLGLPGYNLARLVKSTGKSESTIRGKLKLLALPENVQTAVEKGELPAATAELIGRLKPELQAKAVEQIVTPKDSWTGQPRESLSFRDAKEVIDELKAEQQEADARAAATVLARAEGYEVLEGKDAEGVISYADRVTHNCGYVAANEVCARDPQARTWREIVEGSREKAIEGIIVVRRLAVMGQPRVPIQGGKKVDWVPVAIYARDEANTLLKQWNLWDAEGSAQAQVREDKRRAVEKKAHDEDAMARDFEVLIDHACRQRNPREALLAAVWSATSNWSPAADKVARRRDWMPPEEKMGRGSGIVRSMATDLDIGELQGLVVELALFQMGTAENFYAPGRKELRRVFDLEYDGEGEEGAKPQTSAVADEDDEDEEETI